MYDPHLEELNALYQVVAGTADATGRQFFKQLVQSMAEALRVQYAFVSVFTSDATRMRVLAFWDGKGFQKIGQYDVKPTPCSEVVRGQIYHCARDVQSLFPDDTSLKKLGAHSYRGVPLIGSAGEHRGHLAVMDTKPMEPEPRFVTLMQIFATRAAAELDRLSAERAVYVSERRLRRQNQNVADIQRSLLPAVLPEIPMMDLAVFYQPADQAGGDYYDILKLPDDRWGFVVADVAGHGTPAAVLMAVVHAIVHTHEELACCPSALLSYLNEQLLRLYTRRNPSFVTAFYAIYEPASRQLTYASAGHPAPRLKRCANGELFVLDSVGGVPLGVFENQDYRQHTETLAVGDQIIFFTDGLIEAGRGGQQFGLERLDAVLENCGVDAPALVSTVCERVSEFAQGEPFRDDQTIVVAKVTE
jgi:sigma-B regulation protein RsbU (phosphoserine phosphatase)